MKSTGASGLFEDDDAAFSEYQKRYKRYPEYACRGRAVSTSVETGTCKEERRGGRNPTVVSYDITAGRCNDYRDSACTDGILKNTIIGSILSGL